MSINPSTNVNSVCQFIMHVHKICQILTNIAAHISLLKAYLSLINHCNSLYGQWIHLLQSLPYIVTNA